MRTGLYFTGWGVLPLARGFTFWTNGRAIAGGVENCAGELWYYAPT